jgi:uncharacterized membrane protein YeiH
VTGGGGAVQSPAVRDGRPTWLRRQRRFVICHNQSLVTIHPFPFLALPALPAFSALPALINPVIGGGGAVQSPAVRDGPSTWVRRQRRFVVCHNQSLVTIHPLTVIGLPALPALPALINLHRHTFRHLVHHARGIPIG